MKIDLDQIIEQIISTRLFLRLKDINENNEGWHDNESTFDHLVKTSKIARDEREGEFIQNRDAKKCFQEWMEEDISGVQRKDIVVISALVHDCGKLLSFKEANDIKPIMLKRSTTPDQTMFPSHEYWGGKLVVKEILKDISLPEEVKKYIAESVKQHGVFPEYFNDKDSWSTDEIITDIKSQAEGLYKESLFNMYCDGYTASAFLKGKEMVEKAFSESSLYNRRTYFIP